MSKLNVLVCEKFSPYYQKILEDDAAHDVVIIPFPCLCDDSNNKAKIIRMMNQFIEDKNQSLMLCGIRCDSLKQIARFSPVEPSMAEYCLEDSGNENQIDLQTLRLAFLNEVYKWELSDCSRSNDKKLTDLKAQYKEYSLIFDQMGDIAALTNKRDAIEKIKEIYRMIFKAKKVKFWSAESETESLPEEFKGFISSVNKYLYQKKENRFCIKIQWNDRNFGMVQIDDLLSQEYAEQHVNFALDIMKICGAVLSNIEEYEHLLKSQKELKYISYHDPLTGLYNRAYLNVLLERQTDNVSMIVFLFDIDRLKSINEMLGHSEGDKLIKNTASVLKKTLRDTDCLARVGGDEFAAILPQSDRKTAETVQKRIEEEISLFNSKEENPLLKINVSMGFAVTDENQGSLEELLHFADEQMNESKQRKNDHRF